MSVQCALALFSGPALAAGPAWGRVAGDAGATGQILGWAAGLCLGLALLWGMSGGSGQGNGPEDRPQADDLQKYKALFDLGLTGLAFSDPRTRRFLEVNDQLCQMTGYSREELTGFTWDGITHPDDRHFNLTEFARMVSGEAPDYFLEKRYVRKDGSILWLTVSCRVINGPDGKPAFVVGAMYDLSDRKRMEENLKASEERFAKAFQASPAGMALVSLPQGRVLEINPAFARDCGLTPTEILGHDLTELRLFDPADFPGRALRASVQGATLAEAEVRLGRPSRLTCLASAEPMRLGKAPHMLLMVTDITERKRAEEALKQSEQRFRVLLGKLPAPLAVFDAQGRFEFLNERFSRVLGYTREDIPTLEDWWPKAYPDPDYREEVKKLWQHLVDEAARKDSDIAPRIYRVRTKKGHYLHMEIFGARVNDKGMAILLDLTEKVEAQHALEASENRFRTLFDQAPVGAALSDLSGKALLSNRFLQELLGYGEEELFRLPLDRHTHPEDRALEQSLLEEMRQGKRNGYSLEKRLLKKDGQEIWVSYSISRLPTREGDEAGLISTMNDITANILARDGLRDSQERLSQIIDFLPDPTWVIDGRGRVMAWNRAMETLTGIKAPDMLGKGDFEYSLPLYGKRRPALIDLVLKPNEELEVEYPALVRRGHNLHSEGLHPGLGEKGLYLASNAAPLYDSKGRLAGAIETLRDITGRKLYEEKLKKAHAQLAAKAGELGRANDELAQFTYVVSHDLKAPLRAIHNYADWLREDLPTQPEGGEIEKYLDGMSRAIRQGEELVNDLLVLSRLGANLDSWKMVDMNQLLGNLAAGLPPEERAAITLAPDLPMVFGQATLIGQIFSNLLTNALKFNQSPEKKIRVAWLPTPGGEVVFSVEDNGIGIEPRHQEQIFTAFQRLHTRQEYDGTGIGLAIVRKAAGLLKGAVFVESSPGEGSTFSVRLPSKEVQTDD